MPPEPFQVLQAAAGPVRDPAAASALVIAGATGVLGNEVLRRVVGLQLYGTTHVLAKEPMTAGLRGVTTAVVEGADPATWRPLAAQAALVLFDPPRMFYERERALWTPAPEQLVPLAAWLRRSGVDTLAVVLP